MIRAHVLLSSLLCLAACQSPRASSSEPATQPAASATESEPDERPKVDLAIAIATAQASAPEAHFLGAEFRSEDAKSSFRVLLVGEGVVHTIEVDPTDGRILGSEDEQLDEESLALLEEIRKEPAKIGIDKAIAAALERVPGSWASWAGPAHDGQHSCYGVVVIHASTSKYVLVSAQDGKVLSVRDPEEEDEGEELMEEAAAPAEKPK